MEQSLLFLNNPVIRHDALGRGNTGYHPSTHLCRVENDRPNFYYALQTDLPNGQNMRQSPSQPAKQGDGEKTLP